MQWRTCRHQRERHLFTQRVSRVRLHAHLISARGRGGRGCARRQGRRLRPLEPRLRAYEGTVYIQRGQRRLLLMQVVIVSLWQRRGRVAVPVRGFRKVLQFGWRGARQRGRGFDVVGVGGLILVVRRCGRRL